MKTPGILRKGPSGALSTRDSRVEGDQNHAEKWVPPTLQRMSRLSNLPRHAPCFIRSSGPVPHREIFDMARQTKIKFAALATAVVATLSLAAVSPAASVDSGKTVITHMKGEACC